MRILAVSGSLRVSSSNTVLLRALAELAPAGVEVRLYEELAQLPHFNPDLDIEPVPEAVREWRSQLASADGVVFSAPEYAHGVPGSLKNALDWVVGSGELVNRAVVLFNASARGMYAQASLTETLTVMTARVASPVTVNIGRLTVEQAREDTAIAGALRQGLGRFVEFIGAGVNAAAE